MEKTPTIDNMSTILPRKKKGKVAPPLIYIKIRVIRWIKSMMDDDSVFFYLLRDETTKKKKTF